MRRFVCLLIISLTAAYAYPAKSIFTNLELTTKSSYSISVVSVFGEALFLNEPNDQTKKMSSGINRTTSHLPHINSGKNQTQIDYVSLLPNIDSSSTSLQSYQLPLSLPKQKQSFLQKPISRFIIPTALISYGVITQFSPALEKLDINIKNEALKLFPGRIYLDDWTQYAPSVIMFSLKLAGVKSEHNLLGMTIFAATSYIFTTAFTRIVKAAVDKRRPDGSALNSFPSGHTSTAFAGAHLLYREYRETAPWVVAAGYTIAAATGIMRITNRRHWFSDVIAGAGVGILSVELAYLLIPVFDNWLGWNSKSSNNFAITPVTGDYYNGIGLAYSF